MIFEASPEAQTLMLWAWDRGWIAGYILGVEEAAAQIQALEEERDEIAAYAVTLEQRLAEVP